MRRVLHHPVVRFVLLGVTFGFIAWALAAQWDTMRAAAQDLKVGWGWVLAASSVVLATYALLIQSWRLLLRGWGGELPYGTAVRIWTIANLGRYLPGKVWSIGALGVMASREGVSGVAAAGAAVLGTVLNIGAGFAVTVIFGAEGLDSIYPGVRRIAIAGAIVFGFGVLALPLVLPTVLNRLAVWRGLPLTREPLRPSVIWIAAAINCVSWIGYGVAFALFAQGVTPRISSDPALFIAVYSASYLVGFLALFAPGGIGVREYALVALLVGLGAAGNGEAVLLSATSRLWLTALEVLPGTIGLLLLSPAQRATLKRAG